MDASMEARLLPFTPMKASMEIGETSMELDRKREIMWWAPFYPRRLSQISLRVRPEVCLKYTKYLVAKFGWDTAVSGSWLLRI